jgi:ATP/maltotriose-dependent transcriptional regulator MalT/DNA-binding SARP family transcriptional activator
MVADGGSRRDVPARGKAIPPSLVEPLLHRPELESELDEALKRRLAIVVADAGFGKSTLLAAWAAGRPAAWYTVTPSDAEVGVFAAGLVDALSVRVPALAGAVRGLVAAGRGPEDDADEGMRAGAHAALLADALDRHLARDMALIIDDLSEIAPTDPAARLVESLTRMAPARLHLVVASRTQPPFPIERIRGQGQVLSIGGARLAFTAEETEALLVQLLGVHDPALAAVLHQETGGWPAAVRLAAEALRPVPSEEREASLVRILRPGGAIYGYLAEEALARSAPEVRDLLDVVAPLERFTPELCGALGTPEGGRLVPELAARGLYLRPVGDGGWYELTPLVREFLRDGTDSHGRGRALLRRAATWYVRHGDHREALHSLTASSDPRLGRFVAEHGASLLAAGEVDPILAAVAAIPAAERTPEIAQLEGEALQVRGDWDGALRCFAQIAEPRGRVAPGVAWRMGLIHHLRGELNDALAAYRRGRSDGSDLRNEALLHAWWASAMWLRGDADACRELAARSLTEATEAGDDSALAASHTVLAMVAALDSDRRANDAHYLRALDHATRAHDVLQAVRIRANRGSRFTEEGYLLEAVTELDEAIRLADLAGFPAFRALALANRGQVLLQLGRLDEAITELEASRDLYQRMESRLVSYPLGHLGEVYRERGDMALARASFDEAIAVAEGTGDQQALVPALSGLARVLVRSEPERARQLADRAVAGGPVLGRAAALLAVGWVAMSEDRTDAAHSAAEEAETLARQRRDRAALAESIELLVRSAPDPGGERDRLDEAMALWRDIGNPIGVARVEVAMAELLPPAEALPIATRALAEARRLGARRLAGNAARILERIREQPRAPVEIRTFGGFEVLRDDRPVPLGEWRSRKARDILKVLVAARGGRVVREQLLDTFWPEEDADRSSPRLSVALSTIRSVLDPSKTHPPDHFLDADRVSARIRTEHLTIDAEHFHAVAERGLAQHAAGDAGARVTLGEAEAAYRGDFLGEDPYAEWAVGPREDARSVYQRVAAALAALATRDGESGVAVAYLRRMLERDPWDESAHLQLVSTLAAAGQHGEARRAYRTYAGRMQDLAVEAAPFPESVP